jgi:carboxymethylenebutenolidase
MFYTEQEVRYSALRIRGSMMRMKNRESRIPARSIPQEQMTKATESSPTPGYLARPASGHGPGVLVLHAWWGLNATFKGVCDRLAAEGFVAYAPDLYRGRVATTIEDAERLSGQLNADAEAALQTVQTAVDTLLASGSGRERGVAVIGFSLGAYYAIQLSGLRPEHIRNVVMFYGAGEGDYARSQAAYLGHFAENDPYESAEWIDKMAADMRAAGRSVTIHTYAGAGHWFFEPDRPDAYHAASADLAWTRTLAFLRA